jgi:hypothetical protein
MKKLLAVVLCAALAASGCATANAGATPRKSPPRDAAMMAGYVRSIPAGSPVRVGLAGGGTLSGTLLGADETGLVVQPRGRRPEAPREVPIGEVLSVEIQRPSGVGKVIAIGATAGAAATLGVLLLLYAALGGD